MLFGKTTFGKTAFKKMLFGKTTFEKTKFGKTAFVKTHSAFFFVIGISELFKLLQMAITGFLKILPSIGL